MSVQKGTVQKGTGRSASQRGFGFDAIEADAAFEAAAAAPGAGRVDAPGWPADLTRRLHILPLVGMRRGDSTRDAGLRHYGSLALRAGARSRD